MPLVCPGEKLCESTKLQRKVFHGTGACWLASSLTGVRSPGRSPSPCVLNAPPRTAVLSGLNGGWRDPWEIQLLLGSASLQSACPKEHEERGERGSRGTAIKPPGVCSAKQHVSLIGSSTNWRPMWSAVWSPRYVGRFISCIKSSLC